MKSICASLEDVLLTALRGLDGIRVPVVGLLEQAAAGTMKQEDLTALQLRVFGVQQPHEAWGLYQVQGELRLTVMQADSADGAEYRAAYEAVACWMERVMLGDTCTELDTDELSVDGFQLTGGDADYDSANGVWYAVWNVTLTGRLNENESADAQEVTNG